MRTALTISAMTLAIVTSHSAFAATELASYMPFSRWNVDYSDDSCALRRGFKNGKTEVLFELRQFEPGDGFSVAVVSPAIDRTVQPIKVRFAPINELETLTNPQFLRYPKFYGAYRWRDSLFPLPKDERVALLQQLPDEDRTRRENLVTGLEIEGLTSPGMRLEIGPMNQAMTAMRSCMDELLTHWGIDAAAQKTLTRRVKPADQQKWAKFIQDFYPENMLRNLQDGIVRVRVIVGENGLPKSCHIQIPSQDRSFEAAACDGMMRASKFFPALDRNGKPIDSFFTIQINYKIN